jgi:NhaP-type Na+/H+ or K+/H+ antiporter
MMTLVGLAAFGMAWMPAITKVTGISYSIIYVVLGMIVYMMFPTHLVEANPIKHNNAALYFSEMVVIISLMGSGIKIDRPFSFKSWSSPLKLILIAMLICIAAVAFLGYYLLGFTLATAVLLGAILAPTDPVLASDVQVGPPNHDKKSETKFTLTAEAGMNDGTAFPFTWLAIVLALNASGTETSLLNWFGYHLVYKIVAGILIGYFLGKFVGYLLFTVSKKMKILKTQDGFVAIALMLVVYGVTEMLHAYGFVAVFVCAYSLRHYEKGHGYHENLHSFTDQIERLLVAVLLILFGGSLVTGILNALTWKMALFSILLLLVIRPLAAYGSIAFSKFHYKQKLAISFFGIRGMGSIFYLAFAIKETTFDHVPELWAIVAFTILLSVILHGLTATPIMKYLEEEIEAKPKKVDNKGEEKTKNNSTA